MAIHEYSILVQWAGSTGGGYRAYGREYQVHLGSDPLTSSADPAFRGDAALPNPEKLLLAAVSSCQMLSFLAVAARARLDVLAYQDEAAAVMPEASSEMRITEVVLRPRITIRGTDVAVVAKLVETAHRQCFIANSLNASVRVEHMVEAQG